MRHKYRDRVITTVRDGLIVILAGMCVVRAGVQIKRMVMETPKTFYPEIVACGEKPTEAEAWMVWQYRNLEAGCEK